MSKLFNRAKMTTTTTGTGTITLGSAVDGFVTFATAGVVHGDLLRYCIEAENGTDFEIGEAVYSSSTATRLLRLDNLVQLSSNSNTRIDLGTGTHHVFVTALDADFTQEIIVTVAGGKFVIDGTSQQIITLLPSITYRLDQSDSTNASHPLVLASGSADGSTYSTGVRTVGTPGSKGAYTEVKLHQDAPALWYKCSSHSNMGASVNTGAPSGGVTSVANQSAMLALSSPSVGDMVYRQDNYKLMMYNGSGWYAIATINTSPTVSSVSQTTDGSTSTIAANGTFEMTESQNTVVTITGADAEEGTTLTYSATVTSGTQSDVLASLSQSSNVFTLAPVSSGAGGTITIRFDVSDSAAVGNQSASFSISFAVVNSRYTSLLLHASAAGTNSTFTDSSSSGHTITASGDPSQGSFSPYRKGGFSLNMSGTGGLSLPSAVSSGAGASGAYTWEMWVYIPAYPRDYMNFIETRASETGTGIFWGTGNGSNRGVYWFNSTTGVKDSGHHLSLNSWHHVALCRSSTGVISMFADGNRIKTGDSYTTTASNPTRLGDYIGGNYDFQGEMTDVRILNGTELYTGSTYTVPTQALAKISNTVFLYPSTSGYRADYSDNSHAITEIAGTHKIVPSGPYDYSEANADDGGSIELDSSDYFSFSSLSDFDFGTNPWTINFWFYADTQSNNFPAIFSSINYGVAGSSSIRWDNHTAANKIYMYTNGVGDPAIVTTNTLALKQWHYVTITRENSTDLKIYINGSADASVTISSSQTFNFNSSGTQIGRGFSVDGAASNFVGFLADLRIIKGTGAVQTSVPTAPLTAVTNTKLLVSGQGAKVFDKSQSANLTLSGNTTGHATTKIANAFSVEFDGSGDYISLNNQNIANFGTSDFTAECWFNSDDIANYRNIMGTRTNAGDSTAWCIAFDASGKIYVYSGAFLVSSATGAVSANTWYYVSYSRDGSNHRLHLGTSTVSQVATATTARNYTADNFAVGKHAYSASEYFNGNIQNLRITKGLARYSAADYTAPTTLWTG